jgi:hypothetical protein
VDAAGHVAGFGLASGPTQADGTTSEFTVVADKFSILHPNATHPTAPELVFTVANGVTAMDAAFITNLTADMITSGTFRTATSGYRTEISSVGNFPLWVGTGNKNAANALLALDTSTNKLTFKGDIDVANATSGERLEIKPNVLKIFDAGGVLRVKLGDLSA